MTRIRSKSSKICEEERISMSLGSKLVRRDNPWDLFVMRFLFINLLFGRCNDLMGSFCPFCPV